MALALAVVTLTRTASWARLGLSRTPKWSNPQMVESIDTARLKLTSEDGSDGVLLGSRCGECGACSFGPAVLCQRCASGPLDEVELSPCGALYSYTQVHVPPAGWPGPTPYVLGQVELPEGPHVLAEVVDSPFEDLAIGATMALTLHIVNMPDTGEEKAVYKWRVAAPEASA